MPTVPNWIAKGYVCHPGHDGIFDAGVYKVTGWRATTTQVIVTLEGLTGEFRFDLGNHRYAYRSDVHRRDMVLISPDDDRVTTARETSACRRAVNGLNKTIAETRLDPSVMDAETLVLAIGRIQRAATKAMADLAEVL